MLDRVGVKLEDIVGAVVALSVARCVFDASGFVALVLVVAKEHSFFFFFLRLCQPSCSLTPLTSHRDDLNSYVDTLHLIVNNIDSSVHLPIGEYLEHFATNQPRYSERLRERSREVLCVRVCVYACMRVRVRVRVCVRVCIPNGKASEFAAFVSLVTHWRKDLPAASWAPFLRSPTAPFFLVLLSLGI